MKNKPSVKDIIIDQLHKMTGGSKFDLNNKLTDYIQEDFDVMEIIMAVEYKLIVNIEIDQQEYKKLLDSNLNEFITWVENKTNEIH